MEECNEKRESCTAYSTKTNKIIHGQRLITRKEPRENKERERKKEKERDQSRSSSVSRVNDGAEWVGWVSE